MVNMNNLNKLAGDENEIDPEDTERMEPVFPLAGMSVMCVLVSPDGRTHWVRKNSMVFRVMKSHGYSEVKK